MLYPLTRICPVYCTSIGGAASPLMLLLLLDLDERLDDWIALDFAVPKAELKLSEERAGKFKARAAL